MPLRLYIVDDHAIVRDGLKAIFSSHPDLVVVGEAADGRAAVSGIAETRPDVVLMDLALPQLNGIEATRVIRQRGVTSRVLILSMHATSEHLHRAFEAGADGYLLKESAGGELLAAIQDVSRGQRYLSRRLPADVVAGFTGSRAKPSPGPLERLSTREREVLQLVVEGQSSAEIAAALSLSQKTVETYRSRLMAKLAVQSVVELVRFAVQHHIVPDL